MELLVLSEEDVTKLIDLDHLLDAVAGAMVDLSSGEASMPARVAADVTARDAFLAAMPAFVPSRDALTTKLVSLFPHNTDRPTHQALICVFDPANGSPIALMNGTYVTAARTAACSALSVRLLARPDARVLAVIGAGVQARAHARAVARVRPIETVRIAARDPMKARALVDELRPDLGVDVEASLGYDDAQAGADIVCACTHASEPVVRREWLSPGVHVTSVGYNLAGREVDAETVRDSLVVVESLSSALAPPPAGSNDLLWPVRDGVVDEGHVSTEIGRLVTGAATGRTSDDQITLYKSVGVAVQDAAAAAVVLAAASAAGAGRHIRL